ncbi:hypothetical protein [Nocardioides sp. 616]|uniref:hypothetical protein n=1 Tax=Nocardioides sp. 616 TaxID=2268090 RepID=UPI000CE35DB4|nr:hypothetical protein [Nocardioides sp. 616]
MLLRPLRLAALLAVAVLVMSAIPASAAMRAHRTASAGVLAPAPLRAMWVWDRPGVASLVDFATSNGVGELFVHVPSAPSLGWYTNLRTRTRAAGIEVHALGSETWWIDDPEAAVAWQREVLATGLFDGVHLDIEPWLHADWDADRSALLERYLHLLDRMAESPVPVELDISFWLHEITAPDGGRLDEAVLARVDAVTVMSYRDTATGPDSITGLGGTALAAATRAGKPARLAVETNDLGATPVDAKQTFHGERRARLVNVLAQVDAAVAANAAYAPSYAGIAVHDRRGWAAMKR